MPFIPPVVTMLRQETAGEDVLTCVAGDLTPYGAPLAPAGLYDQATQSNEHFQLHKLVHEAVGSYTFRTFKAKPLAGDLGGLAFVFRPWWTHQGWTNVADTTRTWQHATYPDDGSHAHCELTYVGIGAQLEQKDGYFSGGDWITCEAYERFVRNDEYRCRE